MVLIILAVIIFGLIFPKYMRSLVCSIFAIAVNALNMLIIAGLLTAFLNCQQMYEFAGFTPFSLIYGDSIYDTPPRKSKVVVADKQVKPRTTSTKRKAKNGVNNEQAR